MPFVAKEKIASIANDVMAPTLKARGYRKSGLTWRLVTDSTIKIVNIQLSRHNLAHDSSFTINLGVFHPGFHEPKGSLPPKKSVTEPDCDIRVRIGQLMGKGDHWWSIAHNKDNSKVRDGVRYNFEKHALPWIDRIDGLTSMYNWFYESQSYFNAAIAAKLLGQENVNELIGLAIQEAHPNLERIIRKWGRNNGIGV